MMDDEPFETALASLADDLEDRAFAPAYLRLVHLAPRPFIEAWERLRPFPMQLDEAEPLLLLLFLAAHGWKRGACGTGRRPTRRGGSSPRARS